ncbi:hypothetical protein [Amycolatopsis keratiniphila]|uniref:hypothetical protein n=1 Tax=Amycolatopsis keratiniphila TaxID=129921 RepID=UPI00118144AB|nr:hypothetical protein [Amycolatopsis keratiniphila]
MNDAVDRDQRPEIGDGWVTAALLAIRSTLHDLTTPTTRKRMTSRPAWHCASSRTRRHSPARGGIASATAAADPAQSPLNARKPRPNPAGAFG